MNPRPVFPFPQNPGAPPPMHSFHPQQFPQPPQTHPSHFNPHLMGMQQPPLYPPPHHMYPPRPNMYPVPPMPSMSAPMAPPGGHVIIGAPSVPSSHVIVGAPTLRVPTAPVPHPNMYQINIFNASNAHVPYLNATCDTINKVIFKNPLAGLPMTVYIGNIPLDYEDAQLTKLLEICGKITKFVRPVDPKTQIPASLSFATFAQSICALRAVNIFNNFVVNLTTNARLVVKLGTKESSAISSVRAAEVDASSQLPEEMSLEKDIYSPILSAAEAMIREATAVDETGEVAPDTIVDAPSASSKVEDSKSLEAGKPINYYSYIGEEEGIEEEKGEKFLQSEIDKFRQRQQIRDQHLEEQRKKLIKQKIQEMEARRLKQEAEKAAAAANGGAAVAQAQQQAPSTAASENTGDKRKASTHNLKSIEDDEDLEARKRRRLQVLQELAGDADDVLVPKERLAGPIRLGISANRGNKAGVASTVLKEEEGEDEGDQPKRTLVTLDLTEEELREIEAQKYIQHVEDDDDDEALDGTKRVRPAGVTNGAATNTAVAVPGVTAPIIPQSVQAKVLAQAQAISAALSAVQQQLQQQQQQQQQVPSAVAVTATAPSTSAEKKDNIKQIVDRIPSDRESLLGFTLNWEILDKTKVIEVQLKEWVVKKIVEFLGEEEPSLTTFIIAKLKQHCTPNDLLDELSIVLESDADGFVQKLWKMLVYYSLKGEADNE